MTTFNVGDRVRIQGATGSYADYNGFAGSVVREYEWNESKGYKGEVYGYAVLLDDYRDDLDGLYFTSDEVVKEDNDGV